MNQCPLYKVLDPDRGTWDDTRNTWEPILEWLADQGDFLACQKAEISVTERETNFKS